jgi:hypothetical protein
MVKQLKIDGLCGRSWAGGSKCILDVIPKQLNAVHCCQKRALNEGLLYLALILRSKWREQNQSAER